MRGFNLVFHVYIHTASSIIWRHEIIFVISGLRTNWNRLYLQTTFVFGTLIKISLEEIPVLSLLLSRRKEEDKNAQVSMFKSSKSGYISM